MTCACFSQVGGDPPGTVAAAAIWTENYLGDFTIAPEVDLTDPAPPNPTVVVANSTATAGQVASALWTSNAGDALATVTQGGTANFDTVAASGLVYQGIAGTANFTETAQHAPHIWTFWDLLLGGDPRAGVDICYLAMFSVQTHNTNSQASGCALYEENDGIPNPTLAGTPAIDDEKRLAGWVEFQTSRNIICREESTQNQQLLPAGQPAGYDVVGLMFSGRGLTQAVVGVSVGGLGLTFPAPETLTPVPGPFFGGSVSYPSHPYLVPEERVSLAFQQQLGSTYNATISRVQVSTRGG